MNLRLLTLLMMGLVVNGCSNDEPRGATTSSAPSTPATPPAITLAPGTPITFSTLCALCHGIRGEGNLALRAPSIAGLPDWYVRLQLEKFRSDQRGAEPRDAEGQRMHAIARLLSADDIQNLAYTVAAMEHHPNVNTLGGDAVSGRTWFEDYCSSCHRYNGSGELAFNSAPLTGLQDWYLLAQLTKFRSGVRGRAALDEDGAKMHLVANDLSEAQFRDVLAYVAELAKRYP
jgi:cytochrome c553